MNSPLRIGPNMFNLMDGLEINFANDGTWLAFKDHRGNSAVIRLESIATASGVINSTIAEWSKDRRAEYVEEVGNENSMPTREENARHLQLETKTALTKTGAAALLNEYFPGIETLPRVECLRLIQVIWQAALEGGRQ